MKSGGEHSQESGGIRSAPTVARQPEGVEQGGLEKSSNWNDTDNCRSPAWIALAAEAGELGLWSWDAQIRSISCNVRCKDILGLSHRAAPPSYDDFCSAIHWEEFAQVKQTFESCARNGERLEQEFRIVTPSGEVRWVQARGRLAGFPGGATIFCGTLLDITTRKQAEDDLTQANLQLQQFAYETAHDLQEPLRNVALLIQLAQLRLCNSADDESLGFLRSAMENAHHLESMVSDLLSYSRLLDDPNLEEPVCHAEEALQIAVRNLTVAIRDSGAEITWTQLPTVGVRQTHLVQLFQNLLSNAIKHRATEPPRVHVEAAVHRDACQFSVADNGLGIEPEFHQQVFDVFTRLRKQDTPGTGIGLALCKRTVEYYGGKIWIESTGSQGTTFFFTVPYAFGNE